MRRQASLLMGFFLFAIPSLCWCIYRDLQIEKQYPGDLRNRVVGSRMQLDGASPYFHHWRSGEGLRYYDWDNYSTTLRISNSTATPFFHQLLYPLANLPQRTISRIWLVLEYASLLVMTALAWLLANDKKQKMAVCAAGLLFLYTYAWLTNVEMGQLYIFIPLAAMVFYFFVTRKAGLFPAAIAGISAVSLVLIRPNALFFLLPFLLVATKYSLKYKIVFCVSAAALLLISFGSSSARFYWSEYAQAMREQVQLHQDLHPSLQRNEQVRYVENFEGWNRTEIKKANAFPFYQHSGEHGNVFVLLNAGLHVKTPLWVLSALCTGLLLLICFFIYKRWAPFSADPFHLALLGSLLYMGTDFFSPVHRFLYNGCLWVFPLLLIAGRYGHSSQKSYLVAIMAGLLLNSLPVYLFPMQHSLGEYILFAALLGILLLSKPSIIT